MASPGSTHTDRTVLLHLNGQLRPFCGLSVGFWKLGGPVRQLPWIGNQAHSFEWQYSFECSLSLISCLEPGQDGFRAQVLYS